jgi:hypothetical protein
MVRKKGPETVSADSPRIIALPEHPAENAAPSIKSSPARLFARENLFMMMDLSVISPLRYAAAAGKRPGKSLAPQKKNFQ